MLTGFEQARRAAMCDGDDAYRRTYWRDQVKARRSSGLSARAWRQAQGCNVHTLQHWAWRFRPSMPW
jgi:hypothetical protein